MVTHEAVLSAVSKLARRDGGRVRTSSVAAMLGVTMSELRPVIVELLNEGKIRPHPQSSGDTMTPVGDGPPPTEDDRPRAPGTDL
jgi:hypothetical protein